MRSRSADPERGSATAELAVALPAVALVLALCLAGVQLGARQVGLEDAAADAARALGRGDGAGEASAIAGRNAPGATLAVTSEPPFVCAMLTAPSGGLLAGIRLRAESCALDGGR
ncbi:TadE family type IV pilus minor pilin [Agromyces sp. MMS24-JH15]|uniref:TadE family type IV pilus minor pilin n=1 Tax=Agromyces sp. MMS24-JH15 TaxID=3243765 RepID=UPI00374A7AA3